MGVNRRIRQQLGVVTDTSSGKAARPSPEETKPEDKKVTDLAELETPELVSELDDAVGKVTDAIEAVRALTDELNRRLAEGGAEQRA